MLEELALDYPLPKVIMEHRGFSKLRSTYTDKLPKLVDPSTGRLHTSYHQAVTATGRLSSSDPNLQNIPIRTEQGRRIRQAFVARPGYRLVAADYSQIELRIMAHLSGDKACSMPSPRAATSTPPPPPRSSAWRSTRSPASSGAAPRRSTSG